VPTYKDPDVVTPIAECQVKVFGPTNALFEQTINMRVDKKVMFLEDRIRDIHMGAAQNIVICKDIFSYESALDPNKTFIENGITSGGKVNIIYDYTPNSYPLLY
jgi:hypothetical protein